MSEALLEVPPSGLSAALAEQAELVKETARRCLLPFTTYTYPDYEVNWHHALVASKLDAVLDGRLKRVIFLEPPQNGKSEQVSRRFPALALGRNPDLRIIALSYADGLAQDMSRDVQKIMDSTEYQELFPGTRLAEGADEEKRTQNRFDVVGRRGYYIGAGIMGGITGKSLDIGIVDDPIKNRAEAESEAYRDRVWDQFKSAFMTRQFGSECAIVICLTRWHEDDLVGRLTKLQAENPDADKWEIVRLPAIADDDPIPGDPRKPGEALWPAKYPLRELRKRKAAMGEYDWAALFQQRPSPAGGGLVKEIWFKFLDAAPRLMRKVRGWDTGATEDAGCFTSGTLLGEEFEQDEATGAVESTGRFVILDNVAKQFGPDGVDKLIKLTAQLDGKGVPVREEREGGSAGPAVIVARTKMLRGWDYKEMPLTGSKVARSRPFRAQLEAGNVYLLRGDWNKRYVDRMCAFAAAHPVDEMDSTSCAFNAVLLEPEPVAPASVGMTSSATW